jgi:ABC-2 type transport system ATP-binding protein
MAQVARHMAVIEANGLTKSFRTTKKAAGMSGAFRGLFRKDTEEVFAVRDVSFQVDEGEFVGFLGPNGAGKTTTLKILSGLLHPTSGQASVLGYTPWERKDGYRRKFALLLGQKNQLWWDLPARESFVLNAEIYGLARDEAARTTTELSELLGVKEQLGTPVRELSLGERMKCELIAALLHQPKVLFLDEPTIGLDVVSARAVRDFLRRHNKERRTTILLTSHYMADIQELCERVIVIDKGRIFFDGRLAEIVDRFADSKLVTMRFDSPVRPEGFDPARYGEVVESDAAGLKIKVQRDRVITVVKALLDELPVRDFGVEETPIEDVIRRMFQESKAAR